MTKYATNYRQAVVTREDMELATNIGEHVLAYIERRAPKRTSVQMMAILKVLGYYLAIAPPDKRELVKASIIHSLDVALSEHEGTMTEAEHADMLKRGEKIGDVLRRKLA